MATMAKDVKLLVFSCAGCVGLGLAQKTQEIILMRGDGERKYQTERQTERIKKSLARSFTHLKQDVYGKSYPLALMIV